MTVSELVRALQDAVLDGVSENARVFIAATFVLPLPPNITEGPYGADTDLRSVEIDKGMGVILRG